MQHSYENFEKNHPRDVRYIEESKKFSNEHATYAVYLLNQIRETRDRRGSIASEKNHSSVLSFLNGGAKGITKQCEAPMKLIKDLFSRQKKACQQVE